MTEQPQHTSEVLHDPHGPVPSVPAAEDVHASERGPVAAEGMAVEEVSEEAASTEGMAESAEHALEAKSPEVVPSEPGAAQEPDAVEKSDAAGKPDLADEPEAALVVAKAAPVAKPAKPKVKVAAPVVAAVEEPKSEGMHWYILKVQSNREDTIRDGLMRRVAIQGLGRFFGDIIVPTEKVTEFKGGKKRVIKRKLYPGYIVVHMEINEDTWFLVRETPGIGDFTGASGVPTPMLDHEVARIVAKSEEKSEKAPELKIAFSSGDKVKINEGTFENFEGEVDSIDKTNGRVTVMISIFNRTTPVELEYWQVEAL